MLVTTETFRCCMALTYRAFLGPVHWRDTRRCGDSSSPGTTSFAKSVLPFHPATEIHPLTPTLLLLTAAALLTLRFYNFFAFLGFSTLTDVHQYDRSYDKSSVRYIFFDMLFVLISRVFDLGGQQWRTGSLQYDMLNVMHSYVLFTSRINYLSIYLVMYEKNTFNLDTSLEIEAGKKYFAHRWGKERKRRRCFTSPHIPNGVSGTTHIEGRVSEF